MATTRVMTPRLASPDPGRAAPLARPQPVRAEPAEPQVPDPSPRRRGGTVLERVRAAGASIAMAWIVPLALLAIWYVASEWHLVSVVLLPPPQSVGLTLYELIENGDITANLSISMQRVLTGFAAGAVVGLALGIGMGLSPLVKDYLYPMVHLFAQVPILGWLPLLMMLVGIGEALKLVLVGKAVLVPVALNTLSGLEGVPRAYAEVARIFGFSRWQMLARVIFPAALPQIWNGLRFGLMKAWLALVAVELLASSEGIGFMTAYGRQLMQLDVVLAAVVVVGLVGWGIDRLLTRVESRLLRWRPDGF